MGFRNSSNWTLTKESNFGDSTTVPDMTLSLRDLITRHMSGGRVSSFTPSYVESSMVPTNLERMSKVERAQMVKDLAIFQESTRGRIISLREAARIEALRQQHAASAPVPELAPVPAPSA